MRFSEIVGVYRSCGWRDFYGRAMRRLSDFAVPQISYAQSGEDQIVDYVFASVGVCRPSYLEIGTNHPCEGNNTYKFYRKGCSGILVEADPSFAGIIPRRRPRDRFFIVEVATGETTELTFYAFEQTGHSTFDAEEAEIRMRNGCVLKKKQKVPILSINTVIESGGLGCPDFLSIDIEGLDLPVLKTLDFAKYPIPVICAETCCFSADYRKDRNSDIAVFLEGKGYFLYADTYINSIFVNRVWFEGKHRG